MKRRLLHIDPAAGSWRLETLAVNRLEQDPREDYFALSGETLSQYLLRRVPHALIVARGPMPFLSGNKTSVGYVSPLTGLPHYSFVGGRAAAQLLNLGLDALYFQSHDAAGLDPTSGQPSARSLPTILISGRAPDLTVTFKPADELPKGQRGAFYWLLEHELDGDRHAGSIFTVGDGAHLNYRSANLAVDAIYHAGRGGAGHVFARYASALVLRGEPLQVSEFFSGGGPSSGPAQPSPFARNPNAAIAPLLDTHCARLASKTGGTIVKLAATGADPSGKNTLPASNAQRLGYALADLGGDQVLKATRHGQTGCHWCQVDCRHWHWVPADYTPEGRDMFLDDFEPTYAVFAMLGLSSAEDSHHARLELLADVNQRLILPIEQLGCDVIDVGVGLAALFEGVERNVIPSADVPGFLAQGRAADNLDAAVQAIDLLRSGQAIEYPALRAVGDGPQALAERYPAMQDFVFTGGKNTLGNAGHCKQWLTQIDLLPDADGCVYKRSRN